MNVGSPVLRGVHPTLSSQPATLSPTASGASQAVSHIGWWAFASPTNRVLSPVGSASGSKWSVRSSPVARMGGL